MVSTQAVILVLSLLLLVGALLLLYHRLNSAAADLLIEAQRLLIAFVKAQNDVIKTINILTTGNVEEGDRQKAVVGKTEDPQGGSEGEIISNHRAHMKPKGGPSELSK